MSLIGVLTKKFNYSVTGPASGCLVYSEGNREYTFPVFEEDGVTVIVGTPSLVRVHYFFNWYPDRREISATAKNRMLSRLAAHVRAESGRVRLFDRQDAENAAFVFHPELFEHRNRAREILEEAGCLWLSDYSSIDPVHEDYGLEIEGIREDRMVKPILDALRQGFPHWHHYRYCFHNGGRDPGWSVTLSLFPCKSCSTGQIGED